MKYPAVLAHEPGARGDILSVAFASSGIAAGCSAKVTHLAPYTTSQNSLKSVRRAPVGPLTVAWSASIRRSPYQIERSLVMRSY